MRQEQQHIDELFNERGKNDFNSTTLANTLDKDIQTVFNSPEKFVLELLQNADDASDENSDRSIDVTFLLCQRYLIVSHTGKHFDQQDVEALCDNAQQHLMEKKLNLNKTGYKGIGFKSVFVIADCVYILSRHYSFRFDSQYPKWNHSSTARKRYPWQIIPIWTHHNELPKVCNLDNSRVNFIFQIKADQFETVPQALHLLLENPHSILFLRNIRHITININGHIQSIKLKKLQSLEYGHVLYVNEKVKSKWFIISKQQYISDQIHHQLQQLKDHECPAKLKNTDSVHIRFAIQLDSNDQVKLVTNSNLFCYLPTKVSYQLPFLVNADFLLSADRMQLLLNIWNKYLFQCIGRFHIELLEIMTHIKQYRNDILTLFTPELKSISKDLYIDAYNQATKAALDEIAFIPSHLYPWQQLKWCDAITDDINFFNRFPNTDPKVESKIASYKLRNRQKLCNQFNRSVLTLKIENYASKCLAQGRYEDLLAFMISTYTDEYIQSSSIQRQSHPKFRIYTDYLRNNSPSLADKAFLLTMKKELVRSHGTFLPLGSDNQLQQFLSSLKAHFICPTLLKIPHLVPWLNMIGVSNITDSALIKFIKEWILDQDMKVIDDKAKHSVIMIQLLKDISPTLIEKEPLLSKLPLITKCGNIKPANTCYLPSALDPKLDLEKITGNNTGIVNDAIYSLIVSNKQKLMSILISLKVQYNLKFFCGTFYSFEGNNSNKIAYFDEYRKPFEQAASYKECRYHMAYLPYMNYLKVRNYAKIFFKHLQKNNSSLIEGMANFRVFSKSNRNSYNYDVDHYLKFMLNRERCILANDGQYYYMNELYTPSLIEQLDAKFTRHLPSMNTKFGNETIALSDSLMGLLGARQELSYQDVIQCFNVITDEDAKNYNQLFMKFYKLISKASWLTYQINYGKKCLLQLLATDGSRQPATSLYHFSSQYLFIQRHRNSFMSFAKLTQQEELSLCRLFGVHILKDEGKNKDYSIHFDHSFSDNQTHMIQHLFKMLVITVDNLDSTQDMKQLYHKWIIQLENMPIVPVKGLVLRVESDPNITFKADVVISVDHHLYYEKELELSEYIEFIAKYLQLPSQQIGILSQLALMKSDQQRERYLRNHQYDISAITKLDVTYFSFNDCHSNLSEEATCADDSSSDDDIKVSQNNTLGVKKAAKKLRLSPADSQRQVDKVTHDLNDDDLPHKLLRQYFHDVKMSSYSDDEEMSSLQEQATFKPCSPDEAVKATVQLKQFDGKVDPSYNGTNTVELAVVLQDIIQSDCNETFIPLSIDYTASSLPCHQEEKEIQHRYQNLNPSPIDNTASSLLCYQGSHRHDKIKTNNQWTGRWGEEFAYKYFIKHYENKLSSIQNKTQGQRMTKIEGMDNKGGKQSIVVTWLNSNQESNQPYDIIVTKNHHQRFIEVKTTYKSKDLLVKISHMQWKCMCQYRNYRLCCIYNAGMQGNAAPIVKQIKDPATAFFSGTLIPREIHFKL